MPYTYTVGKSNVSSVEPIFRKLGFGVSTFYTKDANGCKDTTLISIAQPPELVLSLAAITPSACNKPLGMATVSAKGGTPDYQYLWDNKPQPSRDAILAKALAGKYTHIVTDRNGCTDTLVVFIKDEDGPILTQTNSIAAQCAGSEDGAATVLATGGHPPYSYL